jgi:hypothetical protein
MRRRRVAIAAGIAGLTAVAGVAAWRLSGPPRLGLERSRIVTVTGETHLDDVRAQPAQVVAVGATIRTGRGSVCFSVRASRVCVGANGEVTLAELGASSAALDVKRGTLVVASAGDDLRVTFPSGTVDVRSATVAIEADMLTAGPTAGGPTVRALDGSVGVEPTGKPSATVATPDAIGMIDGKKRPPAPSLEQEERDIAKLASRWQGSAGGILDVEDAHGRVEVDGASVGLAPAGLLLDEGQHTLVVRDAGREVVRETVELRAGHKIVRGG